MSISGSSGFDMSDPRDAMGVGLGTRPVGMEDWKGSGGFGAVPFPSMTGGNLLGKGG